MRPAIHYVTAADGTRLAWSDYGARDGGRTVVLTNGLSTTDNFWRALVDALAPRHRVVHWSYRGHGESDGARSGDYAIATHADDLLRVSAAVQASGDDARAPVHVAFSMGVTVLLEALRRREHAASALVLIAGGADAPFASMPVLGKPRARRAIAKALDVAAPIVPHLSPIAKRVAASRALFPLARATGVVADTAPREEVERFLRAVGAMDLRAYVGSLRSLMEAHASDVLPRIRVPTLVIAPERDPVASPSELEAMARAIPGAEHIFLARTGHAVLLEAGDTIAERVVEFVDRQR